MSALSKGSFWRRMNDLVYERSDAMRLKIRRSHKDLPKDWWNPMNRLDYLPVDGFGRGRIGLTAFEWTFDLINQP